MIHFLKNLAIGSLTMSAGILAGSMIGGTIGGCYKYTMSNQTRTSRRLLDTKAGLTKGSKTGACSGALASFIFLTYRGDSKAKLFAAFITMPLLVIGHLRASQLLPQYTKSRQFTASLDLSGMDLKKMHDKFGPTQEADATEKKIPDAKNFAPSL